MREIKYQMETLNTDIACKPLNSAHFGGGVRCKALLAAVLLGTMPAVANELDIPTLGDESAYTLTKVDAAGENTITKFEYNSETGEFTPVYYRVNLRQTTYGAGNASYQVEVNTPSDPVTVTIKYNDGTSGVYDREYSGALLELEETNPGGEQHNHYQVTGGAVKDPDFSGDVLFENNTTHVTLNASDGGRNHVIDVLGGALNNSGDIDTISGAFINNTTTSTINEVSGLGNVYGYGGALYNSGNITNINADFIGNKVSGDIISNGGAIANRAYTADDTAVTAAIGSITGDFIGNHADSGGGAIYNYVDSDRADATASIGSIAGNFIGNSAGVTGGAIHNDAYDYIDNDSGAIIKATIGDITGDFIGNHADSGGGAIYNSDAFAGRDGGSVQIQDSGTIGNITGSFIGNYAGTGGAIYNRGTIETITGDFIGNYVDRYGGAIYQNYGTIGTITGDFIGNYAGTGGAIANSLRNYSTIDVIKGDFIGNHAEGFGGAIYQNQGIISSITGDFIGNYTAGYGGAVFNYGETYSRNSDRYSTSSIIDEITGNFIGNYTSGIDTDAAEDYVAAGFPGAAGGAIGNFAQNINNYNRTPLAIIGDISGDFIGNYAQADSGAASGGAIANFTMGESAFANIGDITGDFIGNYAQADSGDASGGAIANFTSGESAIATIDTITGDFIGNYAQADSGDASGGAIYNTDVINSIQGEFRNNYAEGLTSASGGAIFNQLTPAADTQLTCQKITVVIVDTEGNPIDEKSFYMFADNGHLTSVDAAIALSKKGAAVATVEQSGTMTQEEYEEWAAALEEYIELGYATDQPVEISSNGVGSNIAVSNSIFVGNKAVSEGDATGGAVANGIGTDDSTQVVDINLENEFVNSSFYNNTAESKSGTAKGGAIYSTAGLKITADNGQSVFSGNKVINNGVEESNAIYMDTNGDKVSTLTLNTQNDGVILFEDKIDGSTAHLQVMTATTWNWKGTAQEK